MRGDWQLCERSGWPDNMSCTNLLAWTWVMKHLCLIVVNLSENQARANKNSPAASRTALAATRCVPSTSFERDGTELGTEGFYVDLPAWEFHFLVAEQSSNIQ